MTAVWDNSKSVADRSAVIAVYENHSGAEEAVRKLQKWGFDMKKLSVVGKDYHPEEQVEGLYNAGDRLKHWGKWGALWGGVWGALFGTTFFSVPGVGPLRVGGPLSASVVAALEGAMTAGGLSALGGALCGIGIPRNRVCRYETAVRANRFLAIAHGNSAEVAKAREILATTDPAALNEHALEKPATPPAAPREIRRPDRHHKIIFEVNKNEIRARHYYEHH
jgi:hypothetical protein